MVTAKDEVVRVCKEAVVAVIVLEERSTKNVTEDNGSPFRESNSRSPEYGLGIDGATLQA
jgi:hypothetical protein